MKLRTRSASNPLPFLQQASSTELLTELLFLTEKKKDRVTPPLFFFY
jgi:hypothetical protein